jgi:pyrroloquinoline quinone biosynthesis protein B
MKAVVLGSAAGGGFPQWNCRCANCALAWAGNVAVSRRTQASLAVSATGQRWTLINAAPELSEQVRARPELRPTDKRNTPIDSVVLTGSEIDQIAGLLSLREGGDGIGLFSTRAVRDTVWANPVFGAVRMPWRPADDGAAFDIDGLAMLLVPVPGKVPLYRETDAPSLASDEDSSAVLARHDGRTLLYVPGCAELSEPLRRHAEHADIVMFDGTLFSDDEMIVQGLGQKTGRRMGHMPMTGEGGSLAWLAGLPAARKIYIHINNSNPVLRRDSPERRMVEAAGVEIAHDGMEIAL